MATLTADTLTAEPLSADAPAADYHALNAMLNLYDEDGRIQFERDHEAAREYFRQHILPNSLRFDSVAQRLAYLVGNDYYDPEVLDRYPVAAVERLTSRAESHRFRFATFLGAFKFHTSYALSLIHI